MASKIFHRAERIGNVMILKLLPMQWLFEIERQPGSLQLSRQRRGSQRNHLNYRSANGKAQ
ncbi:MAG: hypothetical protein IH907_10140 [Proteobacteria bacterium]|nr:hypothetical protein [Pseudomonadota bacterium]